MQLVTSSAPLFSGTFDSPVGVLTLVASDRGLRRGPVALVVDHYFPTPDRDAGSRCTQALVSSLLALGFKVIFLPENFAPIESYRRRLEGWGVLCLWGDEISQSWPEWLSKQVETIDLILYNRPHITARFLPTLSKLFPAAHRLYNTHDLHGWRQALEAQQPAESPEQLAPPPSPPAQLEALRQRALLLNASCKAGTYGFGEAYEVARVGGAAVLEESNLGEHILSEKVEALLGDPELRASMSEKIRAFHNPSAAEAIADGIIGLTEDA